VGLLACRSGRRHDRHHLVGGEENLTQLMADQSARWGRCSARTAALAAIEQANKAAMARARQVSQQIVLDNLRHAALTAAQVAEVTLRQGGEPGATPS